MSVRVMSGLNKYIHTHTQHNYSNPRCAWVPRVKKKQFVHAIKVTSVRLLYVQNTSIVIASKQSERADLVIPMVSSLFSWLCILNETSNYICMYV